jgi:ribose transport system ATP-binding protein
MLGIYKSFPGVKVLDDVSFSVRRGEVHALVGENGAGKSTLMKILSGAHRADKGEVRIDGETIAHPTPALMLSLGVAVIYQELMLAPHLTVAENIFLGRLPRRSGVVDWGAVRRGSLQVMDRLGFLIDPSVKVAGLSVAQRQMIEIARALSRNARILVLDEPSAVLGDSELEKLFNVIRQLRLENMAFVYISHRLKEVSEIAQTVTVLRDGRTIGTRPTPELTTSSIIRMMVGRDLTEIYPPRTRTPGKVVCRVKNMTRGRVLKGVSFELREGEILGVCGLAGAGRSELLRAVVGADAVDAGAVELNDHEIKISSPRVALQHRIGLCPEDRKIEGLFLNQSVAFNITIAKLARLAKAGFLNLGSERDAANRYVGLLQVRTPGPQARIGNLSGGNQQKCVLARNLFAECKVLLIDEPTRGVDVGAKREIYQLLTNLADQERAAIVMVSSELPEILGLSDRILVMREGEVAAELSAEGASEELIMTHAALRHNLSEVEGKAAGG